MFEKYRWKNRILIAYIDSSGFIDAQRDLLDQVIPGLIERDMVLLGFGEGDAPYSFDSSLDLDGLRITLGVHEDSIVLIGKDGSVKATWREPVDPQVVFDIIDAMPMRRREMQERRG